MSVTSGGIDAFCPDPLWDANLTWYTESPDFTACFHQERKFRPIANKVLAKQSNAEVKL